MVSKKANSTVKVTAAKAEEKAVRAELSIAAPIGEILGSIQVR